jgi:hypothetical protein
MVWPTINPILAIWGAVLSSVLGAIRLLEFFRDRARSRVELVPVIELPPGQESGVPLLSVGNATPNGCRVYEVELVMKRTVKEKENARRMSHYCFIPGTGIIPGFGELRVDLTKALEALIHGLWKGPDNTYYPDIRMWALVRYVGNFKRDVAKSIVYGAQWFHGLDKPPVEIRWLKVADEQTASGCASGE